MVPLKMEMEVAKAVRHLKLVSKPQSRGRITATLALKRRRQLKSAARG